MMDGCSWHRGSKTCSDAEPVVEPTVAPYDCSPHQDQVMEYVWDGSPYLDYEEVFDGDYPMHYDDLGVTAHELEVTAMTYLTAFETNSHIWTYRVFVMIPDVYDESIKHNAFMTNEGSTGPFIDDMMKLVNITAFTGTVSIFMVENQDENFMYTDDSTGKMRGEDEIVAYSWMHYLNNPNDFEWVITLAMTKSVIKVFNAAADFVHNQEGFELTNYMISGASKHGWNAWLVGALDDRVIGIAPVAMDLLNMRENLRDHFRSIGGWSYAFYPYYAEGLTYYLDAPTFAGLECMIDPMKWMPSYLSKNIPIYHTGNAGDEFFLITNALNYLDDAREQGLNIWNRYLINVPHQMDDHEMYQDDLWISLRVFYYAVADGDWENTLPTYDWNISQTSETGTIVVSVDSDTDVTCRTFGADSSKNWMDAEGERRDFRLTHFHYEPPYAVFSGILWHTNLHLPTITETDENKEFEVTWPQREDDWGYRAFYAELAMDLPGGIFVQDRAPSRWTLATPANIMPEGLPFDDCVGADCFGDLA